MPRCPFLSYLSPLLVDFVPKKCRSTCRLFEKIRAYFATSSKNPRVVKTYLWSNSKKFPRHNLHFGIESAAATSPENGENRNTPRFKTSDKDDTLGAVQYNHGMLSRGVSMEITVVFVKLH